MIRCPYCKEEINSDNVYISPEVKDLSVCLSCLNPCLIKLEGEESIAEPIHSSPDIRHVAPQGSIGRAVLNAVKNDADSLPVLSSIASKVLSVMQDPEAGIRDLIDVIKMDAVIAGRVLHVANSAMYGGLQQISDLEMAGTRLGMKTVANIVQATAVQNIFTSDNPILQQLMKDLSEHALITAHVASEISAMMVQPSGEVYFTGGLLHDIGNVAILHLIAQEKEGPLAELLDNQQLLFEVLEQFHPLVGLHIAQRWHLPPEIKAPVYFHENSDMVCSPDWEMYVHTVSLADCLSHIAGYALEGGDSTYHSPVNHPSARFLGLSDIKLAAIRVDIEDKIPMILSAFG